MAFILEVCVELICESMWHILMVKLREITTHTPLHKI